MLGHDATQTHGNVRLPPRKQANSPAKFMFIDPSNGGVNAKPDKVVRSFVMKSARNKKLRSTRPKSPVTDTSLEAKATRRLSSRKNSNTSHHLPRLEYTIYPVPWDSAFNISLASSRSSSIVSRHRCIWAHKIPESTHPSPCEEYQCVQDTYNLLSRRYSGLRYQEDFNIRCAGSWSCLAVQLDAKAERLLHQCEWSVTICIIVR
jgi:hypothetical protein